MSVSLLPLDPATYAQHPLHGQERIWSETNCYVDAWIEVLHSLGVDPLVAGAFPLALDFEGDQWTFFKYPEDDLRTAYGIDVHELNPWRRPLDHIIEQLQLGRLMTVEVDAWYLPDTHGVSYRLAHTKTTIVPNSVDVQQRRLDYFHNASYFRLEGDDFDGLFGLGHHADTVRLAPYTEIVRLERLTRQGADMELAVAERLLRRHLGRRPNDNPVRRFGARLSTDLQWLATQPPETFHEWAFGAVRQFGAAAEFTGAFVDWFGGRRGDPRAGDAAQAWRLLSEEAKALQLKAARATRGRSVDIDTTVAELADSWERAQELTDSIAP